MIKLLNFIISSLLLSFAYIDKCDSDLDYPYEYNTLCYEECPDGTYSIYGYKCEDLIYCNNNQNECLNITDNKCYVCDYDIIYFID